MTKARKPGRPRKTGPKSHPLTFRISDELHRSLRAAAHPGYGINDEARRRLAQSVEIERASDGAFDFGDAIRAAQYARLVRQLTVEAGDHPDTWIAYAAHLPMMIDISNNAAVEMLRARVRKAVDQFLEEARAYLRIHGEPPTEDASVRTPYGTPAEVREALVFQQAMHRHYARKVAEIEANRIRLKNAERAE